MRTISPGKIPLLLSDDFSSVSLICFTVTYSPAFIDLPPKECFLTSSKTAVVMMGGTVSIPNFCNGASGNGFTSLAVKPLKYLTPERSTSPFPSQNLSECPKCPSASICVP